ncbi:4a-hydroxytetrahydrobiopterin dehydratase [Bacteriovorax sp. Seq25_V]|uniref:4a-hydroxytetrahydrobiopterin dehydratase n=1 Tax=Bacteriovorax sp. Seq25_V TaxID=1201288 RepID=UPI00038A3841|nr:4a-hydroxytetrahydrobiopterin dehydratase [Bacteriovorax sp. Seq25_V]EQC46181.1 4a-hydroxytetrahydrobiopterin dehydratase [Bacteriovorax sp. Seq25_V]
MSLSQKNCIPCKGGVPPLRKEDKYKLLTELNPEWKLIDDDKKIFLEIKFKDFKSPMELANQIAMLADEQWHHPDLEISYGRLAIKMWTHKIDDLVESDFIFASKVDKLINEFSIRS